MGENKEVDYYHGVYGYIEDPTANKLLVVKKTKGAYKGKFDLPGGGQQAGETREDTLRREIREETGADLVEGNDYFISRATTEWTDDDQNPRTLVHTFEIARAVVGAADESVTSSDTDGCCYMAKIAMNPRNASPLVLEALGHFDAVDPDIAEKDA